ncbi:MAG: VanZ family protein [Anaerolineae bacterium]|jgi:VanZ family protein
MRRLVRHWAPPLAWMGLIFFLSAQPDLPHAPGPWLDMLIKKLGHALAFGILSWLYLRALGGNGLGSDRLRVLSLILTLLYAVSDEIHQAFVPGRHSSIADVLVDGVGATLAMGLERWRRVCASQ